MARKHGSLNVEEEENEINLTPMLDVVFIMLIFFIVTATFIKEAGIQIERPNTFTADTQDDAVATRRYKWKLRTWFGAP